MQFPELKIQAASILLGIYEVEGNIKDATK